MGRRKRRELKIIRKTIPEIFQCPKCGVKAVSVEVTKEKQEGYPVAIVKCGNCGLTSNFVMKPLMKKVDVYNKFIDAFYSGVIS
jgi:transcription elongation factor Elf1